jgi:hypothetical protein
MDESHLLRVADDLIRGQAEWRNIQDIVRLTCKAMNDVVVSQSKRINELEAALADRPTRAEINPTLAQKASIDDVNRTLMEIGETLERTSSTTDLEDVQRGLEAKLRNCEQSAEALREQISSAVEGVRSVDADIKRSLATKEELRTLKRSVEQTLSSKANQSEVESSVLSKVDLAISNMMRVATDKVGREEVKGMFAGQIEQVRDDMRDMGDRIESQQKAKIDDMGARLNQKASTSDVQLLLASKADQMEYMEALSSKVDMHEVNARIKMNTETLAQEVKQALLKSQQEIVGVLNQKAYKTDVNRSLQKKVDSEYLNNLMLQLEKKVKQQEGQIEHLREADRQAQLEQQTTLEQQTHALESSIVASRVGGQLERLEEAVERQRVLTETSKSEVAEAITTVKRMCVEAIDVAEGRGQWREPLQQLRDFAEEELRMKVNIRDVCTLLDTKSNTADVNDALGQVTAELESLAQSKGSAEELQRVDKEVQSVGQCVRDELLLGRWIWKSGNRPQGSKTVPWNLQVILSVIISMNIINDYIVFRAFRASCIPCLTIRPSSQKFLVFITAVHQHRT